ncbi:short-subunit dehydrogenase [Pseudomonas duriflava]|uniref:Short-subunit dehydrogenase n=1 Tax=Pseudomonas duriflava TaxID=459528 RepID=A0A562QLQ7_9PSED|nr:SDR family oxidoreductase [Pseudomonas duriflava]TWI57603.1 short-subunit dehydrogenase [Pseudomonas duriflava]
MNIRLKPLHEQVIVITGASSGIGLATAKLAAEQGARLVLAARNEEALQDIQRNLDAGGTVVTVVADVGQQENVQKIADKAMEAFGGFDTWINNAATSVWGKFEEVTDEDNRRLFETNFWGTVYGSKLAAAHLRQRGGAIINVGSAESAAPIPFHAMYSASKHAIKAVTDVLRVELHKDNAPVSVTLVRPASTDTLFNDHAKNYLPSAPMFPPPVYTPEAVAEAILHAAVHPQRDVYIGAAKSMTKMAQSFPRVYDWVSEKFLSKQILSGRPDGNRQGEMYSADHNPGSYGRISGSTPGPKLHHSLYTKATQHPVTSTALAVVGGLAVRALLKSRRH